MTKKILYLSVKASRADGDSLLLYQGHPAPAAPTGRSATLSVCTSAKTTTKITLTMPHSSSFHQWCFILSPLLTTDLQQVVKNGQTLRKILVFFLQQDLDQRRQQVPTHASHDLLHRWRQLLTNECVTNLRSSDWCQLWETLPDSFHPAQYWGPARCFPPRYTSAQQPWRCCDPRWCSCRLEEPAAWKRDKQVGKNRENRHFKQLLIKYYILSNISKTQSWHITLWFGFRTQSPPLLLRLGFLIKFVVRSGDPEPEPPPQAAGGLPMIHWRFLLYSRLH